MANLIFGRVLTPITQPILEFDLESGLYRVIIKTMTIVSGPALEVKDKGSGIGWSGDFNRLIKISVELALTGYTGRNPLTVNVQLHGRDWYAWPLPGCELPAIARFKRDPLDGRPAVRLISLESDLLVSQ